MTYKYFFLKDAAHDRYLVAGSKYDGNVYHHADSFDDNAQWRFEDTGDGSSYYIIDRRHGKALIAGDSYDGHLYHQDPAERANAKWIVTKGSVPGSFIIKDSKHQKAVTAGDKADGYMYSQDPGDRRNAQWQLGLATDGDIGPNFYIVKQELIGLELETGLAQVLQQPDLVAKATIRNGSNVEQLCQFNKKTTDIDTEAWNFETSVTLGVIQTVTASAKADFAGISASTESKTEWKFESTMKWGKSVSRTVQKTIEWDMPLKVSANSTLDMVATIKKDKRTIPFVATIKLTMGNGDTEEEKVRGTWQGVEYLAGNLIYSGEAI